MKHNRKEELIACCKGIIRNADKIANDYGHDQDLKIIISMECNEAPHIDVIKGFFPKEVLEAWDGDCNK